MMNLYLYPILSNSVCGREKLALCVNVKHFKLLQWSSCSIGFAAVLGNMKYHAVMINRLYFYKIGSIWSEVIAMSMGVSKRGYWHGKTENRKEENDCNPRVVPPWRRFVVIISEFLNLVLSILASPSSRRHWLEGIPFVRFGLVDDWINRIGYLYALQHLQLDSEQTGCWPDAISIGVWGELHVQIPLLLLLHVPLRTVHFVSSGHSCVYS